MVNPVKLLQDFVIVDLGTGMAPALVSKFLADNGARVIRVASDDEAYFDEYYPAYSVWRRSIECNTRARQDPGELHRLLATADACILGGESHPGLKSHYSAEQIADAHGKLVVLEISGNPHGTPDYGKPSTDLLAQARTGLCYEHYSDKPILMAFEPANYGAALQGLCGLLAALFERNSSGKGQIVRTSLFEGALTWVMQLWGSFENASPSTFIQPKDLHPLIFQCADGVFVHLVLGSAGSKYKLYQVLGIDDPTVEPDDSGMPDLANPDRRNFFGDIDLLSEYARKFDSKPLLEALWAQGLAAEQVLEPAECWNNPQVRFNEIIVNDGDGARRVGNPVMARVHEIGASIQCRAGERPLDGVRVIDFGAYVAGPLATRILADLGADVVKVEPFAGDPARGMVRSYQASNRGKKGVVMDLKSGGDVTRRLVEHADVVTSNFRSGVSERLGIAPASLHAIRGDMIVLESPGYGANGPLAKQGAFDLVMQALCGHEAKAGGEGNPPFWNRTYMVDFAGGMLGAVALLTALNYRAKSGNGVSLEVPLLNAGVFLQSEVIQTPDGKIEGARVPNKAQTGYSPNEALYQAWDGWLAIVARDSAQQEALAKTLGLEAELSAGETWSHTQGDLIARAVASQTVAELIARLEAAGVWVEACRKNVEQEVLNDPLFQKRGTVQISQHPTYGEVRDLGLLFTFSRSKAGTDEYIHLLGEHTAEILRGASFTEDEIAELIEKGVIQ